jgi:D-psicose/D-tagatose/L-ribulose 3-epimerase
VLKDNGIVCAGSISPMFEGRDLIHADEATRASSVDYLRNCITMVKELGSDLMSIVPSEVGKVKAMAFREGVAIEGLKAVNEPAQAAGVRIGIEALNRFRVINRFDQALMLADAFGPDVYHMNQEDHGSGVLSEEFYSWLVQEARAVPVGWIRTGRAGCHSGPIPIAAG